MKRFTSVPPESYLRVDSCTINLNVLKSYIIAAVKDDDALTADDCFDYPAHSTGERVTESAILSTKKNAHSTTKILP